MFVLILVVSGPAFAEQNTFPPASFKNVEQFDFISDELPQKKTARVMMRLVDDINKSLDAAMPSPAGTAARVTCVTCHRGQSTPANP